MQARSRGGATMRRPADVAELVDAHGSGPCGGDPVEVQVLSSAYLDRAVIRPVDLGAGGRTAHGCERVRRPVPEHDELSVWPECGVHDPGAIPVEDRARTSVADEHVVGVDLLTEAAAERVDGIDQADGAGRAWPDVSRRARLYALVRETTDREGRDDR